MIIEIKDKYNENKIWVIKYTSCRHYYLNQKICGKMFYSKFQRVGKAFISDVIGIDIKSKIMKRMVEKQVNKYMIDYEVPTASGSVAIHRYTGTIEQVDKIANACDDLGYKIVNVQSVI